ncbi:MAG: PA14 domain-containing protein [Pseudomonadota bacterium]
MNGARERNPYLTGLLVLIAQLVLSAFVPAYATYTVFYYQDGRTLNSIADAEALIASTTPVAVQTLPQLNIAEVSTNDGNFRSSVTPVPLSVQSNYAIFAQGTLPITTAGDYTFNIFSDDGFSLRINGAEVAVHDRPRAPRSSTESSIYLPLGSHDIEVVYYERTGRAVLEVSHALGNFSNFNASAFALTTSSAPEPSQWALMIVSFILVGWRRKTLKTGRRQAEPEVLSSFKIASSPAL